MLGVQDWEGVPMKRVAKQFVGYPQIAVRRGHVVLLLILPLCGVLALAGKTLL